MQCGESGYMEWWVAPEELEGVFAVPSEARTIHLGDLRSPDIGNLVARLARRTWHLRNLCRHHPQVVGVVIHAESALGWGDGFRKARRGFWQFLSFTFCGMVEAFVENNVLFKDDSRYDFVRDPELLAEEVGEFGLRLALDTTHAAWFYQGWPDGALELVGDPTRVGHLHLSNWAPGKGAGKQHLPLTNGILPIEAILKVYKGEFIALECGERPWPRATRLVRKLQLVD